jgi:hypothetical protein
VVSVMSINGVETLSGEGIGCTDCTAEIHCRVFYIRYTAFHIFLSERE